MREILRDVHLNVSVYVMKSSNYDQKKVQKQGIIIGLKFKPPHTFVDVYNVHVTNKIQADDARAISYHEMCIFMLFGG